ncbi:hypothetical protein SLEP1_g36051 [Rubroshorea leprosula]|uniref:Uncharacterized protein n=1 Tax=Rubroshorea leprosula TaxID=152421 RepID=A0AAV5KQE9_9ROSI|nr:hypothetical protein SLEP1_g36051 [Rubroshorea leprosula]
MPAKGSYWCQNCCIALLKALLTVQIWLCGYHNSRHQIRLLSLSNAYHKGGKAFLVLVTVAFFPSTRAFSLLVLARQSITVMMLVHTILYIFLTLACKDQINL